MRTGPVRHCLAVRGRRELCEIIGASPALANRLTVRAVRPFSCIAADCELQCGPQTVSCKLQPALWPTDCGPQSLAVNCAHCKPMFSSRPLSSARPVERRGRKLQSIKLNANQIIRLPSPVNTVALSLSLCCCFLNYCLCCCSLSLDCPFWAKRAGQKAVRRASKSPICYLDGLFVGCRRGQAPIGGGERGNWAI